MTKVEYTKCEKLMKEAIVKASSAKDDFAEYWKTDDEDKRKVLCERGQNHLGYAQGINQVLVTLGFKHERMKELSDLL